MSTLHHHNDRSALEGEMPRGHRDVQRHTDYFDLVGPAPIFPLGKTLHDKLDALVPGAMPPSVYIMNLGHYVTETFKFLPQYAHAKRAALEGYDMIAVSSCGNTAEALAAAVKRVNMELGTSLQAVIALPTDGMNAQAGRIIRNIDKWGAKALYTPGTYDQSVPVTIVLARDGRLPVELVPENEARAKLGLPAKPARDCSENLDFRGKRIYDANSGSVNVETEAQSMHRILDDQIHRFRKELDEGRRLKLIVPAGNGSLVYGLAQAVNNFDWVENGWRKPLIILACDHRNPYVRADQERSRHLVEYSGDTTVTEACAALFTGRPCNGPQVMGEICIRGHVIAVNDKLIRISHKLVSESGLKVPHRPISEPDQIIPIIGNDYVPFVPLKEGTAGLAAAIAGWSSGELERRADEITVILFTGTKR